MTDKITNIGEARNKPVEEVIKPLEDALALAKEGKITDVVIVGSKNGGDGYTNFSATNVFRLISLCELLKFDLLQGAAKMPEGD